MVWIISIFIPCAIIFQSTFYGYLVFALVFTLLGFRMIFFGIGIAIGWDNKEFMEKSAVSSFCIIIVYTILRWLEI